MASALLCLLLSASFLLCLCISALIAEAISAFTCPYEVAVADSGAAVWCRGAVAGYVCGQDRCSQPGLATPDGLSYRLALYGRRDGLIQGVTLCTPHIFLDVLISQTLTISLNQLVLVPFYIFAGECFPVQILQGPPKVVHGLSFYLHSVIVVHSVGYLPTLGGKPA